MLQSQNIDILIDSQPISLDKGKAQMKYLTSYSHCFITSDKFYTDKKIGVETINSFPLIISSITSEEIKILKSSVTDLKINPIIEAWTTEAMIQLVKLGNGIGYVQEAYVKSDIENGTLKKFDISFTLPKLDIYCGYMSDTLAYAPKKFIEFITSRN